MEELLYWGAILGFYLWSAYRSNKKKAERLMPPQTPPKKEVENPQIPNNKKITCFTLSLHIAMELVHKEGVDLIFIGGKVSRVSHMSISAGAINELSQIRTIWTVLHPSFS